MVNAAAAASSIFVTYFANWAQYHVAPYGPYTPDKLAPIAGRLDVINYAFAYFDPSTFALTQPEPKDHTFYTEINAMKSSNPSLKVVLSVGGWNFPSAHFSSMVSTYVLPSLFALQLHVQSTHHRLSFFLLFLRQTRQSSAVHREREVKHGDLRVRRCRH